MCPVLSVTYNDSSYTTGFEWNLRDGLAQSESYKDNSYGSICTSTEKLPGASYSNLNSGNQFTDGRRQSLFDISYNGKFYGLSVMSDTEGMLAEILFKMPNLDKTDVFDIFKKAPNLRYLTWVDSNDATHRWMRAR